MWRRRVAVPVCSVLTAGMLLVASEVPSSAAVSWSVSKSPNVGPGENVLSGVSCVSATSCKAVGYSVTAAGRQTLIETWNGKTWSVSKSPNVGTNNLLLGVSCVSAKSCKAVGYSVNASPPYTRTFIVSWNGKAWSVSKSPNRAATAANVLNAVSCVSATSCKAVGTYQGLSTFSRPLTLIESWNGKAWSVSTSPNGGPDNVLSGVSCVSATSCKAVGYYNNASGVALTLIESWNGTAWSVLTGPSPGSQGSYLSGVSCVSAKSCKAVGDYTTNAGEDRTLIESWNGTAWSVSKSPNVGTHINFLTGVSCVSATSCKAVGQTQAPGFPTRTLIESWNGKAWTVSASPSKGIVAKLNGVSCVSATSCRAVGYYHNGSAFNSRTLVERYG